jgi:hypothetical protein
LPLQPRVIQPRILRASTRALCADLCLFPAVCGRTAARGSDGAYLPVAVTNRRPRRSASSHGCPSNAFAANMDIGAAQA